MACTRREIYLWSSFLLFVAVLTSWPVLSAHHTVIVVDMPFHLGRIEGICQGLLSGQFPVRVNPVQLCGYGMPTGIFYPDVFLYLPAVLRLTGVPLLACWTVFLIGINILTVFVGWWAFSMYTQSIRSGAVAALFYTAGFLRLAKLYLTMDIGEALAWAFLPAALVAVWVTVRRCSSCWPQAVIFSVCVLSSHILTSIMLILATVLILAGSVQRLRKRETRRAVAKAVIFIFLIDLWMYAPLWYFHHAMAYRMMEMLQQEMLYELIYPMLGFDCYIGSVMTLLLIGLAVFFAIHRKRVAEDFWWLLLASGGSCF